VAVERVVRWVRGRSGARSSGRAAVVTPCWDGGGKRPAAFRWKKGRGKKVLEAPWERRGTRRTTALALGR